MPLEIWNIPSATPVTGSLKVAVIGIGEVLVGLDVDELSVAVGATLS
jgi:hypothetical protein